MTDEIVSGLSAALGHEAPFGDEELANFRGPLLVCGARSLDGLDRCVGLEELTLFGCALPAIDAVARLPRLRALKLLACDAGELTALVGCGALDELEVNFCLARDLRPLLQIGSLRRATLYGGAWTPGEREQAMQALESAPRRHRGGLLLRVDNADAWRINQALCERGLPLRYSDFGLGVILVRPGVKSEGLGVELVSTWPTLVDEALAAPALASDAAAFMTEVAMPGVVQPETGPSRFIAQWQVGDAEDARAWIASASLRDGERALLSRFVGRFGQERFVRETVKGLERLEREQEVSLPQWLKRFRAQAIASVGRAYRTLEVRFDGFDHDPFALAGGAHWFSIGLVGYADRGLRELVGARCALYPIGFEVDGRWRLAVSTDDDDDRRVFLYAERTLAEDADRARVESRRFAVFDSLASMLSRVAALRLGDREVSATD